MYNSNFMAGYWIGLLISCIVFGCITRAINSSKGREGGFWWGFFLGVIGIIVVACRRSEVEEKPSYQSYNNNYSYNNNPSGYLGQRSSTQPAQPKKPAGWKCAKCGKENETSSKFCSECGERRHYKWICASCGKENAPEIKFCPECGNQQTEEQEQIPVVSPEKKEPRTLPEEFEGLTTAKDIYLHFNKLCAGKMDEDCLAMEKILIELCQREERGEKEVYVSAVSRLRSFYKHGCRVFEVDRSGVTFTCPNCGKEARSNRKVCVECSALFRD